MMKMIDPRMTGPVPETGIGLYIHIPFCVRKCAYCDFLSFPSCAEEMEAYTEALCREIRLLDGWPLRTVYIGGGTPSILPVSLLEKICRTVVQTGRLLPDAEWTIECNPATFDLKKAKVWRKLGINRVSMGIQSTDDRMLQRIGRIHTADQARTGFHTLREAGFQNITVDLMMGLPGQTLADWENSLQQVKDLQPEHLSCYSLILEEGTPLYAEAENGALDLPDEETERAMYHETNRILEEAGFRQYEISNWARPGYESRHNTSYWERIPYIGAGLGASSFIDEKRYRNPTSMPEYLNGAAPCLEETLSLQDQMQETMLLGLRMNRGVRAEVFATRFGRPMTQVFAEEIRTLTEEGLLAADAEGVRLTERGRDLANQVFMRFV